MAFYFAQFLSGLAQAATLFLVAAGLSIIFGVTRIVNFAHGSFYMLGAYLAYSITEALAPPLGFWAAVVLAALAVGLIGAAVEVVVLRRTYRSPELFQLLATFGVVLVIADLTRAIYGPVDRLGPRAPGLSGSVRIFGQPFPEYDLFLIVLGPAVLLALWLLLRRTRWGTLVRAATLDREMTAALGVNQRSLFTAVFFLGSMLAGLAGALQVPRESINLHMDLNVIVEAFVIVVIGGLGRISGAFLAAVLIGQLQAFGIILFPQSTLVLIFLIMAAVLMVRPYGLLGRPPGAIRASVSISERPYRRAGLVAKLAAAGAALALLALPFLAGDYALIVVTEMLILALFAASLQFLMGPGGLISFGHAAYFGLGAYAAALLVRHLGAGMEVGLAAAPFAAGLGALLFGWFCVRLTGVYLAMLTLAFAQIVWSVTFQWYGFTGGDNGILGVWPAAWVASKPAYYLLSLALCASGLWLLRRIVFAPFGYALRACRDSSLRADAIGIDARRQQWLAFTIAGACAGLAGGLYAFAKGSVFPNVMGIPLSIDALVMVLLGGIDTLSGPIAGAAVFHGLKTEVIRYTDFWQLLLGCTIIALVVAFPQGLIGTITGRIRRTGDNLPPAEPTP